MNVFPFRQGPRFGRTRPIGPVVVAVLAVLLAAAPTNAAKTAPLPMTAEINMLFNDSSTAPRYHRSWVGSVRNGVFTITADAYGVDVAKASYPVPKDFWAKLGPLVEQVGKTKVGKSKSGCAGGTANGLRVKVGARTLVDANGESCSGATARYVAIENVTSMFVSLVGDFDKFSKRGEGPVAIKA